MRLSSDKHGIGGLIDGLQTPLEKNEFNSCSEQRKFRFAFRYRHGFQEYGKRVINSFAKLQPQSTDGLGRRRRL